ncbi:MAG: PQQ-binding-like beta-propeller repeat protein [Acidobacteriota bacterium]
MLRGCILSCRFAATLVLGALLTMRAAVAQEQGSAGWPQWGGPLRNFTSPASGLADSWPETGPRQLWSRALGEGYSAIVVDRDNVYTMYRVPARFWQLTRFDQEVIVAMDARTGKTVWEDGYDAPLESGMNMEHGPGPHATPLISGNRLFTVGVTGKFYCKDKASGKTLWYHDLIKEYQAPVRDRGYACSPIAHKQLVILPVGGSGQSVMAFYQKDGSVAWRRHDFETSPSSPLLINVDGQDQLVVFLGNAIAGMNPENGDLLWSHPHKTDWGLNISLPVWGDGNLLFVTSAYSGGSRMLRLSQEAGKTTVEEVWFNNRMRVHIGNTVRVGDSIYGSSGDFGPAFFCAVDVHTGKIAWQDRGLSKTSFLYADGKFYLVDEDGNVAVARPTPSGLQVRSKVGLLSSNAWTAPSLAGTTLYLRDRKNVLALDVGVPR